jgi:hypothetical protein
MNAMVWFFAAVVSAALLAVGCAPVPDTSPEALAGACQFRRCLCEQTGVPFWDAVDRPPSWDAQGRAFCPDGYRLKFAAPSKPAT